MGTWTARQELRGKKGRKRVTKEVRDSAIKKTNKQKTAAGNLDRVGSGCQREKFPRAASRGRTGEASSCGKASGGERQKKPRGERGGNEGIINIA